jgi:hypothetical protein
MCKALTGQGFTGVICFRRGYTGVLFIKGFSDFILKYPCVAITLTIDIFTTLQVTSNI